MAIGSDPEVGATFQQGRDVDWDAWWNYMRTYWQPNLMNGYAQIIDVRTGENVYGD